MPTLSLEWLFLTNDLQWIVLWTSYGMWFSLARLSASNIMKRPNFLHLLDWLACIMIWIHNRCQSNIGPINKFCKHFWKLRQHVLQLIVFWHLARVFCPNIRGPLHKGGIVALFQCDCANSINIIFTHHLQLLSQLCKVWLTINDFHN
jgi:hypothetical protein